MYILLLETDKGLEAQNGPKGQHLTISQSMSASTVARKISAEYSVQRYSPGRHLHRSTLDKILFPLIARPNVSLQQDLKSHQHLFR